MLKDLAVVPDISLMIKVPKKPWSDHDHSSDEETVPPFNVHMKSCERIRDKLLSHLDKNFRDKFDFH